MEIVKISTTKIFNCYFCDKLKNNFSLIYFILLIVDDIMIYSICKVGTRNALSQAKLVVIYESIFVIKE